MPRSLVSDWQRVATSGQTADGRNIDAQHLRDMAETYDPATYTATIWYEHIRYVGNFGSVAALKAEDLADGRVALFAQLRPNDRLLALNKEGQKLFTSIEITPNFANSGKAYLAGMAITDEPASLGTSELHFSRRAAAGNHFASLEPLGDLFANEDDEKAAISFFSRLFQHLRGAESPVPTKSESTPMDQKTVEAFASAVDKLGTVATSLESSAATFAAQKPAATEAKTEAEQKTEAKTEPQGAVTAEQFAALKDGLDQLTEKFSAALDQSQGKKLPATTGAAGDQPEAVY